jgi:hypothetical protein
MVSESVNRWEYKQEEGTIGDFWRGGYEEGAFFLLGIKESSGRFVSHVQL